jgi:hypothetical protein
VRIKTIDWISQRTKELATWDEAVDSFRRQRIVEVSRRNFASHSGVASGKMCQVPIDASEEVVAEEIRVFNARQLSVQAQH